MRKAAADLRAAKAGIEAELEAETVCFHLQQSAEKMLKAVLAAHRGDYPFTHDTRRLAEMASAHYPALEAFIEPLVAFGAYAVESRYEELELAVDVVTRDLELVEALVTTVKFILPPEAQP